ncbi:MAG: bacterial Ig-like domain-containing protein [Clostridia bacterium]|nr:bacterial Ig-like domain-containing protein [Clostridia bacterium]
MKKISKIALLLLLLVAAVVMVTACTEDPGIVDVPASGSISIGEDGMPQLIYVRGENIDLSNGMLTINTGSEIKEIPLGSEGVSVSGYNKDQLGEQTVTVTYGEHTTQFTVTVVERMQAIEVVTDYLVGDQLDLSKGRLKITRNDGTNYTVILSNDKVTLSGFDGTSAAKQTVTATYDSGNGIYECKFDVTVYAVESVQFNAPQKTSYKSHESDIDLTGASFTLKGKGGELTREVAVTKEMTSGFDLTAVTEAEPSVTQTITVTYDRKPYSYDITLTYTNISLFKKNATAFAEISFDNIESAEDLPVISEDLGELSLRMMEIYLELSKADRSYITSDECLDTARVALMYGMNSMDDEFDAMEKGFKIVAGELELVCATPSDVEDTIDVLEDYDNDIYRITPILAGIVTELGDEEVAAGTTFSQFSVLDLESLEILLDVFEYMLDLHEEFEQIPADWETVGVNNYDAQIQKIYSLIASSAYKDSSLVELYYHVSNWRAEKDAFEILYAYYYGQEDLVAMETLSGIMLPGELQEMASYIYDAIAEGNSILNFMQPDTSLFMFNYHLALQLAEELKASADPMIRDLYAELPINTAFGFEESVSLYFDDMLEYLRAMEGGFYQLSGGLLDNEAYHALLEKYMEIAYQLATDDEDLTYENSAEYGEDVEAMFAMYVALTPAEQYQFLRTLNVFYGMTAEELPFPMPTFAFDDSEEFAMFTCFFVSIVNDYYRGKFSEDGIAIYNDLVIAMELFAQRFTNENWLEGFTQRMDGIKAAYESEDGMSADDKAAFERYLKVYYDKYIDIRARFAESAVQPELGQWADDFENLKFAIMNVELSYALIEGESIPLYGMFFSAFEKVQALSAYILNNAPADILDVYYYDAIYCLDEMLGSTEEADFVYVSLDNVINTYRTVYMNYQLTLMEAAGVYYIYNEGNLAQFYEKAYAITWPYIFCDDNKETPAFDPTSTVFDKEAVMEALNAFRSLTLDEKLLFTLLEGEQSFYFYAIDAFLQEQYTEAARDVASKLIGLEQWLVAYESEDGSETLEDLKEALKTLKEAYTDLTNAEDKSSFEPFEEMYSYYVELCEGYIADAEAGTGTDAEEAA